MSDFQILAGHKVHEEYTKDTTPVVFFTAEYSIKTSILCVRRGSVVFLVTMRRPKFTCFRIVH
jgi:hypothetical protein